MDLRLTFNTDPDAYDRYRPTYPQDLYKDVIKCSKLKVTSRLLEIGIGTGQATLPFLKMGCHVTAVELGKDLAAFTREKYKTYSIDIINSDFESVDFQEKYKLIYSASAFHWIPIDEGLKKVYSLLEDEGLFAWFSVWPYFSQEHLHIHKEIQKVYNAYPEYFGQGLIEPEFKRQMIQKKIDKRVDGMTRHGYRDIKAYTYKGKRRLSAEDYVQLIQTYSDHKAMPETTRTIFLNQVKDAINKHGGVFNLEDTFILCMGKK